MIDLSAWPEGSRPILREGRPHPGAQLTFTDVDGHRITAFLTGTGRGGIPGRRPGWSCGTASTPAWRTASAKARQPGCATPVAWAGTKAAPGLEAVFAAADLVRWAKLICFAHAPSLAPLRNRRLPYRMLRVAAFTRTARRTWLRIDRTWQWAAQIAEGFHRLRTAFA